MKAVLGIGNPGTRYRDTRHNVGFRVLDRCAELLPTREAWTERFQALVRSFRTDGEAVLLVKPLTFVNRSGQCARAVCDYHRIPPESLLVVVDDVALPLGALRMRAKGSSGSHNGLESIISHLNTQEFPRLRIGIDRDSRRDLADYVLSRFSPEEEEVLRETVDMAAEAVAAWIREGIEPTMNRYNRL